MTRRFDDLDLDRLSLDEQAAHDAIAQGPRGAVVGPLRVWVKSPQLAHTAQALGLYARYDSTLAPAQSELAILVTARIWNSGFEWAHHAPIAQSQGISAEAIEAIAQAKRAAFSDEGLQAVFDTAVELQRDRKISDATYARAFRTLGAQPLIDLVGLCGYYGLISMTINAFDVPDGKGPKLPALDMPTDAYFRAS